MLTLNLVTLGLLNRMAPQLSIFVIGFNNLTVGIFNGGINAVNCAFCEHLFSEMFNLAG
ncbi:hypothetical protein MJ581_11235 [Escherichia coli]|nr:hypothetical protein MJ581_11235 [Escherichia coli]